MKKTKNKTSTWCAYIYQVVDEFINGKKGYCWNWGRKFGSSGRAYWFQYGGGTQYPIAKRFKVGDKTVYTLSHYHFYCGNIENKQSCDIWYKVSTKKDCLPVFLYIPSINASLKEIIQSTMKRCLAESNTERGRITLAANRQVVLNAGKDIFDIFNFIPEYSNKIDPLLMHRFNMLYTMAKDIQNKRGNNKVY